MPLTLHAAWLRTEDLPPSGQLFLWAEQQDFSAPTTADAPPPGKANGRPPATNGNGRTRTPKVPSHPHQVPIGQLRAILAHAISATAAQAVAPVNAFAWLPTLDGEPLRRRGVFERKGGASPTPEPTLEPWQITGLALSAPDTLAFISHLSNQPTEHIHNLAVHVRFGDDLVYWSHAAKFALELLAGQHYLPALRLQLSGRMDAIWQPSVVDGQIEAKLAWLARAMPPLCRAYGLADPGSAPAPDLLLDHFLTALVDAAARTWAAAAQPAGLEYATTDWLQALVGGSSRVNLAPQAGYDLYQKWQAWTEQLYVTADANFRICIALEEPEAPADEGGEDLVWPLRFYLQARANPSHLIPARQIWEALNNVIRFGDRRVDQPQERLLAGLGIAGRLFEPIKRSLRSPQPELTLLNTEEAYEFLHTVAPVLESSGFGLILPDWWQSGRRVRLGLRLSLHSRDDAGLEPAYGAARRRTGAPAAIDYAWELTLGGEVLSRREFERLVNLRSPLVRLRRQWVELDPGQVAAARQFLARRPGAGAISLLEALRLAQSPGPALATTSSLIDRRPNDDQAALIRKVISEDVPEVLHVETVSIQGWLEEALGRLREHRPLHELGEPSGFVGELRAYQRRGVGWLAFMRSLGLGACLADDMGLGKTVQAIALLLHVATPPAGESDAPDRAPALLICPTSVVINWRREIERFAPGLRCLIHHGASRLSGDAFHAAAGRHHLVVTSYGTARRDIDLLQGYGWSDLILDEAQNIKNPTAKQTRAIHRLQADNRVALTGTPVENRLTELWSIMNFLNPGYLGSQERFRQHYVLPVERYNDDGRADELRRLVQPFLLRRMKSDPSIISDLPEKNEMVVYCSLTQEQAALYEQTVQEALAAVGKAEGIQRRGLVLGLLTRLKQISNHPAHYLRQVAPLAGRSGKLNRLTEMLDEALSVGDSALIFTQFVEMGHLLQSHLRSAFGAEVIFLHGGTPATQRDKLVQAFQAEDGPQIFVLSLRAGGSGLNLTRANHVFHYDRWWNPAVENQATDRAFRIGQTRNVQVHKFVVAGTIEERIHDLIESKQALAETIVGSGEEWLTDLDTDQLRDLLALRPEMVEED